MPAHALPLHLADQALLALAERALYWPAESVLFIADVHFGKDATFRRAQRWVPPGTTPSDLSRLTALIATHQPARVILLGDVFHSEHAAEAETLEALSAWRSTHASLDITMIRGNHDRRAGDLAHALNFTILDEGHRLGPWSLHHHPPGKVNEGYVLCGHVHPAARVYGAARQSLRFPCFWATAQQCILPAFGGFTGGSLVRPRPGDQVILVVEGRLIQAPATAGRSGNAASARRSRASGRPGKSSPPQA